MRNLIYTLLLLLLALPVQAAGKQAFPGGKQYLFRIYLKDKMNSPYSLNKPLEFLSQKALDRRKKQGIKLDKTDLPINPEYVKEVEKECGTIVSASKWNNTLLIRTRHPELADNWKQVYCVKDVVMVWESPDSIPFLNKRDMTKLKFPKIDKAKLPATNYDDAPKYYGKAYGQINQLNGVPLHKAGFRGQGMLIAVIDAGFQNADVLTYLRDSKVVQARNFVWPETNDIYAESSHGMSVLSCMATNYPSLYVGTAPEAEYVLLRSEYDNTESSSEEDFWCAAAEYADSLGVDVISSSLGYSVFDCGAVSYKYSDLNGKNSLISAAASLLAKKGIVAVVSAGNQGAKNWKKVNFLADAIDVLAVGAVDSKGLNARFSSVGNTADGRVKPDIMAQGVKTQCLSVDNHIVPLDGTSFSAPVACGMIACLWQALPNKTATDIVRIVKESGNNVDSPDNIFGYGIPDFWKAYQKEK